MTNNFLEKIKKYISEEYFNVFLTHKQIKLKESEGGYEYDIVLPFECNQAVHLRMDMFTHNSNIPYIKIEGCKNCDDIIIDETNKIVYIVEIKAEKTFKNCLASDFEIKEIHTKLFLEYLFMLCDSFGQLDNYEIKYIRWSYKQGRSADVRKKATDNYYKYSRADNKQVFKVERLSKIILDTLLCVNKTIGANHD